MSAKKSWDIAPSRQAPAPTPKAAPRRVKVAAKGAPRTVARKAPAPRAERGPSLKRRREAKRKFVSYLIGLAIVVAIAALLYVLWMPTFRVQAIAVEGTDPKGMEQVAKEALRGTHFMIVPRDSIFFINKTDIREHLTEAYPAVQAITVSATGLDSLKVETHTRASAFIWCGTAVEVPALECYQADAEGLVFAPASTSDRGGTGSSTELRIYGSLEGAGATPLKAHVTYASALPGALQFLKTMRGLGADIASVTLRGDEIDFHTRKGTRITYVIGKESQAAALAASAFPTLDLNDGSINYVDLRFEGKVYVKRAVVAEAEEE